MNQQQKGDGECQRGPTGQDRAADQSTRSAAEILRERLQVLVQQLQQFGVNPGICDGMIAASSGPRADRHTTVVLGERARGKTTLVNRLLGESVLPTGSKGFAHTARVRFGPVWRTLSPPQATQAEVEGIRSGLADGDGSNTVMEGPSPLLRYTTLVDTPGLNDPDADFDRVAVVEALRADLLLFSLSATQLLSETERVVIRRRLLPLTACDLVLVVTHLDQVLTEQDRAEVEGRVARFLKRIANPRVQAIFPPGDPEKEPVPALEELIIRSANQTNPDREQAWVRRIAALLAALDEIASTLPEPKGLPPAPPPDLDKDYIAILEHEHGLSLSETEAFVRAGLAELRLSLGPRFAAMSPTVIQSEGIADVTGAVQALGGKAGSVYLAAMERGLTTATSGELGAAAEGLQRTATPAFAEVVKLSGPQLTSKTRPRPDPKLGALKKVGQILIAADSDAILRLISGTLALFVADLFRRARNDAFREQFRVDAVATVRDWLTVVEGVLLARLREVAGKVLVGLRQRVASIQPPRRSTDTSPTRQDLQTQIRICIDACRSLMQQGERP
jgi:hypothetical protein